ncbi:hypothetical protein QTP88_022439 [Uroleucon formosanum]
MVLSPDKKQISYLKIAGYFITDTPNLLLVYSVDSEFVKFEEEHLKERAKVKGLPKDVQYFLAKYKNEDVCSVTQGENLPRSGACHACGRRKNNKTTVRCSLCTRFVCKKHCTNIIKCHSCQNSESSESIVNEENILISDQDRHNHIPCNDSDINRQMVSTTCKRKALEELFMQPKKIILKELAQNSLLADGLTSNDFNTIRKVIYRSRRKVLPVLPIEAHMALNTSETVTSKNKPFVLTNDQEKNIIFSSTEYKKNSDIGKWIKYTFGLLYLDPEEVSDCFVENLMPECPNDY